MDSHLIAEMEYRHWLTVLDSLSLEVVESAGTSNLHTLVQLPPEPTTSPKEVSASKLNERSAHGTAMYKQCSASTVKEVT